ncbi:glycosyltransferase [Candidatus Woesebacteria bacterium]|nr:glycosyltransferase [Candidatus Woesebacteria bacterium]
MLLVLQRNIYRRIKKTFPQYSTQLASLAAKYVNIRANILYPFKAKRYTERLENIVKKSNTKVIFLYPSPVEWNFELFQRPHHFALNLAKQNYLFFFVLPFIDYKSNHGFRKIKPNLYTVSLEAINCFKKYQVDHLLISPKIDMKLLVNKLKHKHLLYDYMDDLSVWEWGTSEHGVSSDNFMKTNADKIIVSADRLFDDVIDHKNKVVLCKNGVDFDHFHSFSIKPPKNDAIFFKSLKGPNIGYYGALANWIDFKLIRFIAKNNKNYNIILIGLDADNFIEKEKLNNFHNIYFLGPKKYSLLPWYLSQFDVAIIPFKNGDISDSTSPLKLFEYMAGGKPVVTTNMKECKKYDEVLVSRTYEDFNLNLKKALKIKTDKNFIKRLKNTAIHNSWKDRIKTLINSLE